MSGTVDWNTRRYPVAPPYHGEKGWKFLTFEQDLIAGIAREGDDHYSLEETMYGMDAGGDAPGAPVANGVAQQRGHTRRCRDLYGILYRHVENSDLRLMASTLGRDGRLFWLLLERECRRPVTDLEIIEMDSKWSGCSILGTVGYLEDSVTQFSRYLQKLNARRPPPQRKTLNERCTKILNSLSGLEIFAVEALKELQSNAATQRFVFPANHAVTPGERDYESLVLYFDGLWRAAFEKGLIKRQLAGKSSGSGTTVDSFHVADEQAAEEGAHLVAREDGSESEMICWNCLGAGHRKDQCPSAPRQRTFRGMIAILTALMAKGSSGTRSSAPWKPMSRTPQSRPRGQGGGRPSSSGGSGSRSSADAHAVNHQDEIPPDQPQTDDEGERSSQEGASAVECDIGSDWADPCFDLSEQQEEIRFVDSEPNETSDQLNCCQVCSDTLKSAATPPLKISACVRMMLLVATTMVAVIMAIAQSVRGCSARSTVATFLCCLALGEAARTAIPTVEYALDSPAFSLPKTAGTAYGWVVDCGATKHCVPFIGDLSEITNSRPNIRVRVANGTWISVTAVGKAQVTVDSPGGPCTMHLSGVLVVPGLTQRLFSCRHGFEFDQIRTELNESRVLVLPGGKRVPFSNDPKQYTVESALSVAYSPPLAQECSGSHSEAQCGGPHKATASSPSQDLVHARLGHFSEVRVRTAAGRSVAWEGTDLSKHRHDRANCPACLANAPRKAFHRKAGDGNKDSNTGSSASAEAKHAHVHAEQSGIRSISARPDPTVTDRFGQRVYSDLCGPFPVSVLSNFTYAIVFVDRATRWVATYYLKDRSAVGVKAAFEQFIADHCSHLAWNRGCVAEWHTDNGGEFMSADLDQFLVELAVSRSYSVPYAPPTNAFAERAWGTVLRPTRVLLAASGLPQSFWPFAMHHAARIHNCLPSRGLTPLRSPFEALMNTLPDLTPLKVFGCRVFTHFEGPEHKPAGGKLNSTGVEAVHLGLDPKRRGYFVYIPSLRRITTSRNVEFQEHRFMDLTNAGVRFDPTEAESDLPSKIVTQGRAQAPGAVSGERTAPRNLDDARLTRPKCSVKARNILPIPSVKLKLRVPESKPPESRGKESSNDDTGADGAENASETNERASYFTAFLACVVGAASAVGFASSYVDRVFAVKADEGPIPIPKTYREAVASKYAEQWRQAMAEEVQGKMSFNKAWDLIGRSEVPPGRRVLRGKWVFGVKYHENGTVKRFKARWVGCGYAQQEGVDFDLTYASTLRATSFRLLMAITAQFGLVLKHIDVTKAFTQAKLDDVQLYVEQPDGFSEQGKVCKMRMALEGLKQSAHLWQRACADFLSSLGFYRLEHEPCLFRYRVTKETVTNHLGVDGVTGNKVKVGMVLLLGVFVDDIVCSFPPESLPLFEWFERAYSKRFRCTPSTDLVRFMGIEVKCDRAAGSVSLSQRTYIQAMVDKYLVGVHTKLWSAPVGSSPAELDAFMNLAPPADEAERLRVGGKEYMSLVGSLLYAACMTRPDIAYHCAVLGQHMQDPSMNCLEAARGVLAYLGRTKDHCLSYGPVHHNYSGPYFDGWTPEEHELYCWFDSSWGRAPLAMCGHVVMRSGAAVSWSARKLKLIPLSSCEAEYACGANACRDVRYIQLVLAELSQIGLETAAKAETRVITDSQSARDVVESPGVTARTRHFERWMHFMRHLAQLRHIRVQLVKTKAMLADVFTKAVGRSDIAAAASVLLNLK